MTGESDVSTGSVIIFFQHKEPMLGVCLAAQDGSVRVLCENGRELVLGTHRIAHRAADCLDAGLAREQLVSIMAGQVSRQNNLMAQVDAGRLWQRLEAGRLFALDDLAVQVFGADASFDHAGAVLRALMRDRVYFKLQGNRFLAQTPEQVDTARQKHAREVRRQQELAEGSAWLKAVAGGSTRQTAGSARHIELLKDFVVFGREAPEYALAKEMLQRAGLASARAGFDVLVGLGIFDEDENLLLLRHRIPTAWPDGIMEEIRALEAPPPAPEGRAARREDLTGLETFAIDEPFTKDIDDAISFHDHGDVLEIGIHMADAASAIAPGSCLDREAARRGASLYLPEGKVPMLPRDVSEDLLSLKAGATRAATSVFVRLSGAGDILDYRWTLSMVRVARQLCYDEMDAEIARGLEFARLHALLGRLREQRIQSGATWALIPELQVRVGSDRDVQLKVRDRETPSQMLVAECMILANYCAALLCSTRQIPTLYRRQAAPARTGEGRSGATLHELLTKGRDFGRVELDIRPGPHSSLGLPCYVTMTSPIRKYLDLVGQRQLVGFLAQGAPFYGARELRDIASMVQPVLSRLAMVEQERRRYWILKSLGRRAGDVLPALVLERRFQGYALVLPDLLFEFYLKVPGWTRLEPGATVPVVVEQVDPLAGMLKIRLA
jgi:exoribonuclease-2